MLRKKIRMQKHTYNTFTTECFTHVHIYTHIEKRLEENIPKCEQQLFFEGSRTMGDFFSTFSPFLNVPVLQ